MLRHIKNYFILLFLFALTNTNASWDNDTLSEHLKIMSANEQIEYLVDLSKKYIRKDPAVGITLGEKALALTRKLNDKNGEGKALNVVGANQWKLSNSEIALDNIRQALSIFEKTGNEREQALVCQELGDDFIDKGTYDQALVFFIKSIDISKKDNYEDLTAEGNNGIGLVYYYTHQYEKAIEYYFEALKLDKKLGAVPKFSSLYNNLAVTYSEIKDYANAKKYYEMAYDIYVKTNNKSGMGIALSNLGDLYYTLKDYDNCLKVNYQSLKINKEINSKFSLVYNYINLGQVYGALKDNQKAFLNYRLALQLALEINSHTQLVDIYSFLSGLSESQKNYPDALEYYKLYKSYNDSIFTKSSSDKLAEMETKYETVKRVKENEQLKVQNELNEHRIKSQLILVIVLSTGFTLVLILLLIILSSRRKLKKKNIQIEEQTIEINQKNKSLEILNKTKDRLFSIIAHDLRNPFTSLLNLSEILAEEIDELNKEEIKEMVSGINYSSKSVYGLTENLLKWSRMQLGGITCKPVIFDISVKINEAIILFASNASGKHIEIVNNCRQKLFVCADEDMVFSVIQNLLSNAIKFSHEEGKILFNSNFRDGIVEISITDNGVGMNNLDLGKLFKVEENYTTFGTNNEKGSGLGLSICKDIIELHKGTLGVTSLPGKGSTFSFTLPQTDQIIS